MNPALGLAPLVLVCIAGDLIIIVSDSSISSLLLKTYQPTTKVIPYITYTTKVCLCIIKLNVTYLL